MSKTARLFKSILLTASAVLILCGFLSLLARYFWVFDLLTNFVPQYTLLGGLIAFFLLLQGQRKLASIMLVFTLFNVYQMHYYWKRDENNINGSMYDKVTILQFNVNKHNTRVDEVTTWLTRKSPELDVIVLFEVTGDWEKMIEKLSLLYPHHIVHTMRKPKDVAVFSKIPVGEFSTATLGQLDAPIILADMETAKHRIPWSLGVIYPKSPMNKKSAIKRNRILAVAARRIALEITSPSSEALYHGRVLLGDLNITPWSPYFSDMTRISGLRDAQNGKGLMGTWPGLLGDKISIPIDHLLVSKEIRVKSREVSPRLGSDHLPVITTLEIPVKLSKRR